MIPAPVPPVPRSEATLLTERLCGAQVDVLGGSAGARRENRTMTCPDRPASASLAGHAVAASRGG
jgi:hypothetical protein